MIDLPMSPLAFILASQQPKIIAERTKLVSPTILKGEITNLGINLVSPR